MGGNLAAQLHQAQILHDERVHLAQRRRADQLRRLGHFPVGQERVERQVHLHAPDMTIFHRLAQLVGGEIFGALAGIKAACAQIYCVGSVLHCGAQRNHGAGGS